MMQPTAGVGPPFANPNQNLQQQQWLQQQQQMAMQMQQQQQQQQQPPQQQPNQAMAMQQQQAPMMAQQYYAQQPQYQQQQLPMVMQQHQPQSSDEVKTLWVGDLQFWMDEGYLHTCFSHTGELVSAKIIRNKYTGQSEGYGFMEFISRTAAEKIMQTYNGTLMPNTEQAFRMNWASFSMGERRLDGGPDYSIFVGDLDSDVSDLVLQETFQTRYPSVKAAKVVMDANTGRSKGYGFVRFGEESERARAMTEMNGVYCSTRPMRISAATPRKSAGVQQQYSGRGNGGSHAQGFPSDNDLNNTTIFVGRLDPNATDDDLRQVFGQYGDLVSIKIPVGKGCGFVQFSNRACAEEALQRLHGTVIRQQTIRLSWGRSPANKQQPQPQGQQPQSDPNQWNGAYYGQGYESYGYAPPPQDPAMYAYGGYPGYGNYNQQVS